MVQNLQLITEAVVSIHSLQADPYPIPSQNLKAVNGSVLDLKDAFFTIPLHQDSNTFLLWSGKIPLLEKDHCIHGWYCSRDFKIALTCLPGH
jgi:hypothetical protein